MPNECAPGACSDAAPTAGAVGAGAAGPVTAHVPNAFEVVVLMFVYIANPSRPAPDVNPASPLSKVSVELNVVLTLPYW